MHTQRKRKAENDVHPSTKKPVQKRASAACRSCRARKVRCDVLLKSTPCTNCRLDGAECVIAESKRTKFARTADGTTLLIGNPQKDPEDNAWNAANTAPNNELIQASTSGSVDRNNEYDSSDCELQQQSTPDPIVAHDMILSNMFSIMHQLFGPAPETIQAQPDIDLPRFIKQNRMEIDPDDLNYLHKKGAFEIPHFAFRNELLKSFVNYVHVYMPFLDLEDFLQTIYENSGRKRISLLLFQAVMFAGTAFVNMKHLRMAGYQCRRAARKAFFQRVRALYELDYETDQIIVIQTLLLMSYWFETPHDQKDSFHWVGISLALARRNGLHLDIASAGLDLATRRIWRRTWWILYSRDKTIPLGMRRPTRIREDDYDLDIINLDDFEFRSFPTHLRQMIKGSEVLSNPEHQRDLALLFIEKVKLCAHLHQALALQYRTPVHDAGVTRDARMALVPRREATDIAQIRYHDENLEKWFANTPKETRYSPKFACELSEGEEVLHVHRAMLKLLYLATRSTLHLPQIIRALPNKLEPSELHQESLEKGRHTAAEITSIAQDLHHLNLTRYLPSNGPTPLLSAIATHVIDLSSPGPEIKLRSLNSLHQCLQTLLRLAEIYPVADAVTNSIQKIMRDMGVQQLYAYNPSLQGPVGGAPSSDYYDFASAGMDCYGPTSSPKPCPPSLKILDSIASHPRVREGSSESTSENGGETAGNGNTDVVIGCENPNQQGNANENDNGIEIEAGVTIVENPNSGGGGGGAGGCDGDHRSTTSPTNSNSGHYSDNTNTGVSDFSVDHITPPSQHQAKLETGACAVAGAESEPRIVSEMGGGALLGEQMEEQSIATMLKEFASYDMIEMEYAMGEEVVAVDTTLPINVDGDLNGPDNGMDGIPRMEADAVGPDHGVSLPL
ncbi:hypothetical protein AJ78_03729 [Emergomyces pasteurianus Ep9510]|uniref:Zn(2)-C6 fungal-type domain-containing protein n=1 Tax=Emergomyces pasteurianus Ep9510 TaxID=1447872 RepID=A0A1J9PHX8_9EURO|nr:hypothetical protein AJ78_03729 [Emergomyces pasteurianus Ep9510]